MSYSHISDCSEILSVKLKSTWVQLAEPKQSSLVSIQQRELDQGCDNNFYPLVQGHGPDPHFVLIIAVPWSIKEQWQFAPAEALDPLLLEVCVGSLFRKTVLPSGYSIGVDLRTSGFYS